MNSVKVHTIFFSSFYKFLKIKILGVCDLPAESGFCNAAFHKYYYNQTTRTCKEFIYGGCAGNANRFDTPDECESVCINHKKPAP